MRRRRWRTVVLWVGCMLCVLIAGAFVASGFFLVGMNLDGSGPIVAVAEGAGFIEWRDFSNVAFSARPLSLLPREQRPSWAMWNAWSILRPHSEIFVPLYALFLSAAVPTLVVWRFVQKFRRGHCHRCDYNLTGVPEPRCPECGQPFEPKADRHETPLPTVARGERGGVVVCMLSVAGYVWSGWHGWAKAAREKLDKLMRPAA